MLPKARLLHTVRNMAIPSNLPGPLLRCTLLHTTHNMAVRGNTASERGLLERAIQALSQRLPPSWKVGDLSMLPSSSVDAQVKLMSPDGRVGMLALEARTRLEPKDVPAIVDRAMSRTQPGTLMVISRYLSDSTRARLRDADTGYLDLTGNIRLALSQPGLYVETQGATEDPDREERHARSLKGSKAGRIARALIDQKGPPGVRDLATLTGVDAGYVSRVLSFLESEALITRAARGKIAAVDWPALLRRLGAEAPLDSRGRVRPYLDPRGIAAFVARLAQSSERYVISGSLAAASFAPVTPSRLAIVWFRDAEAAVGRLELREVNAGANVLVLDASDDNAFQGARQRNNTWFAAPSQTALDLLSSPGRGPAEAEELIRWMQENEEAWRT